MRVRCSRPRVRGNRRFLTELRKRFLLWRSLRAAQAEHYRQAARDLFPVPG